MKNLTKYIAGAVLTLGVLSSCHKLDLKVETQLTPETFPQTAQHFIQLTGQVYVQFRQNWSTDYFFMQSLSTDEAIMPARGGNWYDGGVYEMHHKHTWNKDNGHVNSGWGWLSGVISKANQSLFLLKNAPESPAKTAAVAEVRATRALAFFMMMDLWGNIPIVTTFGETTPPETKSRAEVFNFIEAELKEVLPNLSTATGTATYGRPNRYTAYAILAKMYLNAEVYTGTAKYNEAVAMCDAIIGAPSTPYSLESDFKKMFFIDNGPQTKEFIFAIPFDPGFSNGTMIYSRYSLPRSLREKFSLNFVPSAPMSTLPEFYANFNDPNDKRNAQWIKGLQYLNDGRPVQVATTKKGYDQFYAGSDGANPITYQVDITPNVTLRDASRPFDAGNDEIAWNMGYRNNKFYCDSTSLSRNQNNDVPVFRYSDILLMKAEAIIRGATPTLGQTALSLVNQLRAVRTTSPAWTSVTLEDLYKERCRELSWECWHRNDMIRFGKYEGTWGFKTDAQTFHRLMPIPSSAMILNPKLKQNPGYN